MAELLNLGHRQRRILNRLYDDLQSFRFMKLKDSAEARVALLEIVKKIDSIVAEELARKGQPE